MDRELRIGVVGFGARATIAQYAHRPGQGSRVVGVCEPTARGQRAAGVAAAAWGADPVVTPDLDGLLALGLDAVMVLTPDDLHAPIVLRTLAAGVHTFSEKPMAITTADCDAMLRAAFDHRARLYIGHNMRHMPVVRQLKALVDDGAVGNVKAIWCRHFVGHGGDFYFHDWHAERSRTTSLLLQKGAHDLDVIHWLAGGYSELVTGVGDLAVYGDVTSRRDNSDKGLWDWFSKDTWPPASQVDLNPTIDVEDISMLQMRLDNGVLASYQQCHFTPDYWRNYTVIGDAGRLENMGDEGGDSIHLWNSRHSGAMRPDHVEVVRRAEGSHGGADPLLVAEFLRFAREGGATDTSPIAARQAVATGCAGAESLRNGSVPVRVPDLPVGLGTYFDQGQL